MEPYELSLLDLVQWSLAVGLVFLVVRAGLAAFSRRKKRRKMRKRRRKCAQCGILEEIGREEPKFGICAICGGVTSRGRSRKLG